MNVEQSGKFLAELIEEDESSRELSPKKNAADRKEPVFLRNASFRPTEKGKLDLTPELYPFQVLI